MNWVIFLENVNDQNWLRRKQTAWIENMTGEEIESVLKGLPPKKALAQMFSWTIFSNFEEQIILLLCKLFERLEEDPKLPN